MKPNGLVKPDEDQRIRIIPDPLDVAMSAKLTLSEAKHSTARTIPEKAINLAPASTSLAGGSRGPNANFSR
jgi:hypothetical protein